MVTNLQNPQAFTMDSVKSLPVGYHGFNVICAVLPIGCVMWCPCRNLFDPVLLCP